LFSVSLLGLALLPLLSPSPARAALAVTGALLLSAVLVAWFSRPRTLGPDECERLIRELSQRPELTIISLTSSENERRGRAGSGYAAVARVPGARSVVLLEASEPASVLDAALRWQRVYGLALLPGWGLTDTDLKARRAAAASSTPERVVGATHSGARAAAVSLVVSAAVLALLVALVATLRDGQLTLTSALLWAFGVGVMLLLALAMLSDQLSVTFGRMLRFERRILGMRVTEQAFPSDALELVRVVSPEGARGRHVLVRSAGSSWAVACSAQLGLELEARLAPTQRRPD